jgi:SAM-dependent methyltransferase
MKVQPWILKRQVWSFYVASAGAAMTVVSLVLLKPAWVLICGFVTIASWWTTRVWTNRDPIPLPHAMGWALLAPRPFQSSRRLKELLGLHGGERLLEVGPGTGKYTLPIASSLGSGGTLEVLDIQQEMLDHLMRRASRAVSDNIVPTMGDATRLPYPDDRFDGAYLITVLGEIPDKDAALEELRRVLKPDGCLVIGEIFFDPDFIPLADLQRHLGRRGFAFKRKTGPWWAYLARFEKT